MSGNRIHTPTANVAIGAALDPQSRTADESSGYVDTRGYQNITWLFHLGADDRTTGDETIECQIEHADDTGGTGLAEIDGATTGVIGNLVPNATYGALYAINVQLDKAGRKRYQRGTLDVSGTTPICLTALSYILWNGDKPPTQPTGTTVVTV